MRYSEHATVKGAIGEGLERGAGTILNAFFMKKKLELAKQAAEAQRMKSEADVRRSDAYTNYLNSRDIMRRVMELHDLVPQMLQAQQAKTSPVNGPGATANQLATNYAPYLDAVGTLPGAVSPRNASTETKGSVPPPVTPQISSADPRVLLQAGSQSLYADGE